MNRTSRIIFIPELGIMSGAALKESKKPSDTLGHQMQSTLVPPLSYRGSQIEAYGQSLPKDDVGGDLMDLVADSDHVTAYVADISGHGFRAGVLMGMVKTAVRYGLLLGQSLTRLLDDLNRVLPGVKEPQMFATLAALRFNNSNIAEYVSAGHVPLLRYRRNSGDVIKYSLPQLPLGLIAGDGYTSTNIPYDPGDIFAIVTDGVLERGDDPDSGIDRIAKLLRNNPDASLVDLTELIHADLNHCGKRRDDETVLLLRTCEQNETNAVQALPNPQREFVKHTQSPQDTWRQLLDDLAEELSHE